MSNKSMRFWCEQCACHHTPESERVIHGESFSDETKAGFFLPKGSALKADERKTIDKILKKVFTPKKPREFLAYKRTAKSSWAYAEYSKKNEEAIDTIAPERGNFSKLRLIDKSVFDALLKQRDDLKDYVINISRQELKKLKALLHKGSKDAKNFLPKDMFNEAIRQRDKLKSDLKLSDQRGDIWQKECEKLRCELAELTDHIKIQNQEIHAGINELAGAHQEIERLRKALKSYAYDFAVFDDDAHNANDGRLIRAKENLRNLDNGKIAREALKEKSKAHNKKTKKAKR